MWGVIAALGCLLVVFYFVLRQEGRASLNITTGRRASTSESNLQMTSVDESELVNPVLIIDTETTGLIIDNSIRVTTKNLEQYSDNFPRIVQVAYILLDSNGNNYSYSTYVKQNQPIPARAINVHGITNEMCEKEGETLSDVLNELSDKVSQCDTIVGYNVNFDFKVLQAEFLRSKMGFPFHQFNKVDAMRSAQKILDLKLSHKISLANASKQILGDLNVYESSIDLDKRHDALSDATTTAIIYLLEKSLDY